MLLEAQQRLLTLRESVTNNMTELSLQHVKLYRALGGCLEGTGECKMTEQENNDRTKLLLKDESRPALCPLGGGRSSGLRSWQALGTGIRARRTPTPSST